MDWALALAGFGVGGVVGLTGMGGGALMTPILVLFFGIPPLAAVSSDLVASAVMKPVGSAVHIRRGRVDWRLVRWLCLGSVPAAFGGVIVAKTLGDGEGVQKVVQTALGVALFLAVIGLLLRAVMRLREQARQRAAAAKGLAHNASATSDSVPRVKVRPVPTVIVGALGGLVVGMTSVGSGSLIIVALLALYPLLRPNDLVGTDLVQAVPLVAAAAVGHLLFGDFQFNVTTALLAGSIPGVFLGAQISSRAPGGLIRQALSIVLLASALKLLGVPNMFVLYGVFAAIVAGALGWMALRHHYGLPAIARRPRTSPATPPATTPGRPADPAGPTTQAASTAAQAGTAAHAGPTAHARATAPQARANAQAEPTAQAEAAPGRPAVKAKSDAPATSGAPEPDESATAQQEPASLGAGRAD